MLSSGSQAVHYCTLAAEICMQHGTATISCCSVAISVKVCSMPRPRAWRKSDSDLAVSDSCVGLDQDLAWRPHKRPSYWALWHKVGHPSNNLPETALHMEYAAVVCISSQHKCSRPALRIARASNRDCCDEPWHIRNVVVAGPRGCSWQHT